MTPPRALVVEDDRSWQQILTELLTDAGLTTDVADSYETALSLIRAVPHRLAVVDLALAAGDHRNEDGLRVLAAIRRHDPGCVTILLTGFATVELAVSALKEYGAYTCLRKERFRRAEFRALMREVLAAPPAVGEAGTEQALPASPPGPAAEIGSGPATVLVVDDDAGWRRLLGELLAEAGHRVRLCSSYGEAWGWLRRETYHLAVLDLALVPTPTPAGHVDGFRLLAAVRQAGIPAIVISGVAAAADAERALGEYDAFAFLEKRAFSRAAFAQTVAAALAAATEAPTDRFGLTAREAEVLDLLVQGLTNRQIAEQLVISPNTVKRHLQAIFAKLGVTTRSAAVAKAISERSTP
ncbi:MAG: response regulator [Anaerolineae bacterium]|nr:response regulator [Caldilineales bacterium]MDW8268465.1 response regulator [Anaerolineae bacterium]